MTGTLIVRELVLGSHRFNEIERRLQGIARSLLSPRLRDLEDAGVVERRPRAQSTMTEYHPSEGGTSAQGRHGEGYCVPCRSSQPRS
jgi:DNA-binding HxlR family transcriptional regulator